MRVDRIVWDLVRGYFAGKGIATDLPGPLAAFLKTSSDLAVPDIQVLNHSAPLIAGPYLWPFKKPYVDGFSLLVVLLRPIARGRVGTGIDRSERAGSNSPEFSRHRRRLERACQRREIDTRHLEAKSARAFRRRGTSSGKGTRISRRYSRAHRCDCGDSPSPSGHLQDGAREAIRWQLWMATFGCAV